MKEAILVLNAGSSSIKFALFSVKLNLLYQGKIGSIFGQPQFKAFNHERKLVIDEVLAFSGYETSLMHLFDWLRVLPNRFILKAVGHRIVHGGGIFHGPCLIKPETIEQIASLTPLAPLHQPLNVEAVCTIIKIYPLLPQVACFDTTFHQTQEHLATLFALPRSLTAEGIIRYGFHGISYEYIASVIPKNAGSKVMVAHLGNGASVCALRDGKSVATSMGFTALDGLMMGTRTGTIDPGVLLYLLQEKMYSTEQLSELLYSKSGLLGVSEISANIQELQFNEDPRAVEAMDLFCFRAAQELCSLMVVLQGCNTLIFTAGIGENSAVVRKKICLYLQWLGIVLDEEANLNDASVISADTSSISVYVIPTNEELIIAKHTIHLLGIS
ncbi:MAG: acetate/propionate family kinase [Legionella sp.]|uniref:acetate/propionate family kinase n=1 Tax=Legionella sp. TaxID=459 RepID=UPI0039E495E3